MKRTPIGAVLAGAGAAFAVGMGMVLAIGPQLLLDPDPQWALARFLLVLLVSAGTASAGVAAAVLVFLLSRTRAVREPIPPLPFSAGALAVLAAAALLTGAAARFAALDRLPAPFWVDDLSLVGTALALHGNLSDFADPVRPVPIGHPYPYGSVGVLYLELYRAVLLFFGPTAFGVRFLSAAAGVLSIATAMMLGRALLPAGGGVLAGLVVAGMRWHLILSRWAWNAIVIVPLLDIALLLLLAGRRRRNLAAVAAGGLVAGVGAHIYLAAWVALAAQTLFLLWPGSAATARWRLLAASVFVAAFFLSASPLFLHRSGGTPYFRRAGERNVSGEMRRRRSVMPVFESAAVAISAPWFRGDPSPWNDLPGRSRLGWILGIPAAVAFARALSRPRQELSGLLLAYGVAAFASTVTWGTEMQPNGYRVAYLTTLTGVAVAAGALSLLSLAAAGQRRAAGIAIIGLFLISGALAVRDLFLRWGPMLESSEGYQGRDNLMARTVLRWQPYGPVVVDSEARKVFAHRNDVCFDTLVRYRLLNPGSTPAAPAAAAGAFSRRHFRVAPAGASPQDGERSVESARDGQGREWAVVFGASSVRKWDSTSP